MKRLKELAKNSASNHRVKGSINNIKLPSIEKILAAFVSLVIIAVAIISISVIGLDKCHYKVNEK